MEGNVPIDNNHIESLMRPWAMGRKVQMPLDRLSFH